MASIVDTLTAAGPGETPKFLNDLLAQLWPNLSVATSNMIKQIAEPMFATMLPSPLNTLHFKKIDLGKVPIKFANVIVHKTDMDGIKMDLDVDWDGQCDIELDASMIPKLGVEHVKLRGRLSILLCPLTNIIPLIGAAQVSFINPPYIHLDFTDAGGIGDLALVDRALRKIVLQIISGMAVLPNRFLVKLDAANDYFKTYQHPQGILRLTIESGQDLSTTGDRAQEKPQSKTRRLFQKLKIKDVPDCYIKVNLSAEPEWRTATVQNDRHPQWNETHDFIVTDHDQIVEADVQDADVGGDDDIGIATTSVKQLLIAGGRQELELMHEEQPTGAKLTLSGKFFRLVAEPNSFGGGGAPAGGMVGLLTVAVASVSNITGRRQDLKPSVKVTWGVEKSTFRTAIKADAPGTDIENPSFDQAFRIPVLAGTVVGPGGPPVRIVLMDKEEEKGAVEVSLEELLAAPDMTIQKEFDVGGGAKVRAGVWLRGTKLAE
ncbi:hypothetical protein B0H66DRAFT_570771 [Apodospora peruviana]|uniref:Extended synaptotagmin-2 n=1 Tax=Apodospora peruviana TaxID=516989 RepID=A0AAE0HTP0_9PEZI|nr:hypothetical protein B0H66DRAFT_570771 [Apodospora peruviana]